MISVLVEPRSARRSSGFSIAIGALIAYAGVASIAAGAASAGAGLVVLAMGLFAATVVDFVIWREIAFGDRETLDLHRHEPAALPPPSGMPGHIEAEEEREPARRRKTQVYSAPGSAGNEA